MNKKGSVYWKELSIINALIYSVIISGTLVVLDLNNIPSSFLIQYGYATTYTVLIIIVLIMILVMIKRHLFSMVKIPCGNAFDEMLIISLLTIICYGIALLSFIETSFYKSLILLITFLATLFLLISRILLCTFKKHKVKKDTNITIDISHLIDGTIEPSSNPLVFSDKASEVDLLNRGRLVNLLYNSIVSTNASHGYVIGVKGKWGSGKTTLLNLTKQKILAQKADMIIIDEFDPWVFGTQESFLIAMYDEILRKTGVKFSSFSSRIMSKRILETIINKHEVTGLLSNLIFIDTNTYPAVKNLKKSLETLLNQINRPIVFFIDNIDRANADNVILLFKLIGTVFDLPNMIYVLAYDSDRVSDIFSKANEIHPQYIEKIVQHEIPIPPISLNNLSDFCLTSIENLLVYYDVKSNEMNMYETVAHTICHQITDIRQFKRLLNSAFTTTFCYETHLHKPHLLAVEVIKFLEPKLYQSIKENAKFFVSRDTIYAADIEHYWGNKKTFNKDGREYFTNLFESYSAYKELLSELFIYVKRFCQNQELEHEYHIQYDERKEETKYACISSAKYFDLYFSLGENGFLKVQETVDEFIDSVNETTASRNALELTKEIIHKTEKDAQNELFWCLQNKTDKININKKDSVALGICESLKNIDTAKSFGYWGAETHAVSCITLLAKDLDTNTLEDLITKIANNSNIRLLDEIIHDCDLYINKGENGFATLKVNAEKQMANSCHEIISENINLYDDEHYYRLNIWTLYRFFKNNTETVHQYIKEIICKENVFRIIGDLIQESSGTLGYGYRIPQDSITSLIGNRTIIDEVLKESKPQSKSEEFVLSIWERMDSNELNEWGESDLYSPTPIRLYL